MQAIEMRAHVDHEHRLSVTLPPGTPPGQVRVIVLLPDVETGDAAEAVWAQGVAREWAADWADPREDIYSLADGEPTYATR